LLVELGTIVTPETLLAFGTDSTLHKQRKSDLKIIADHVVTQNRHNTQKAMPEMNPPDCPG